MSQPNIKQVIRQEIAKSAADPVHFMRKYCYIQHPQKGSIKFNLFPFQEKVLKLTQENPYSIILKSRQMGISTLTAGYALWLMLFHKDRNILVLATTQATAKNMVTKVRHMYDALPSWLKIDTVENNVLTLKLKNGSQIKAKSSNADAARSEAVSLLVIDEAAFIDNISETWASAQQTLATGGGAIVLSTPYGTGNWFHRTWVAAENSENDFLPIKLPWYLHPDRDEDWRRKQDSLLGDPRLAAQECDCNFATSGDVFFYPEYLEYYESNIVKDPIEKRGMDQNLWIWEYPSAAGSYMITADVARGDGKDYSAFHIIDVETNTQVAEYKGQIDTKDYGNLLHRIALEYNNALLVVENANIGWSTLQYLQDLNYPNLYFSPKGGDVNADSYFDPYLDTGKMTPGFTMSSKTRPMVLGKFKEYIYDKSVTFYSKRLLKEMKVFVWKQGRAEAQTGYNDDLVMAFSIAMFMRDTSFKFRQQGMDLTRSALNNIKTNKNFTPGAYSANSSVQNPYKQNIGGQQEDISWLL